MKHSEFNFAMTTWRGYFGECAPENYVAEIV